MHHTQSITIRREGNKVNSKTVSSAKATTAQENDIEMEMKKSDRYLE